MVIFRNLMDVYSWTSIQVPIWAPNQCLMLANEAFSFLNAVAKWINTRSSITKVILCFGANMKKTIQLDYCRHRAQTRGDNKIRHVHRNYRQYVDDAAGPQQSRWGNTIIFFFSRHYVSYATLEQEPLKLHRTSPTALPLSIKFVVPQSVWPSKKYKQWQR